MRDVAGYLRARVEAWIVGAAFAFLSPFCCIGFAAAQIPAMPQIPQPSPMQPAPIPSGPVINPGDAGQQGSEGNNGQLNIGGTGRNQRSGHQSAGFVGGWCAQGDRMKQTSISYNGAYYNLTNESGDTSIGSLQSNNRIQAEGWQFVTGTLTNHGNQIQWSNGTFWARCPTGGGGQRSLNLNGNWYPNGNRSMQCSIQQHRGNLTFQNETGQRATGSLQGKRQIATNWSGTKISGTVSSDGNRIDWSNGTYWIRYRLY
jgi:hypothetical protein